jgi:hypothetical protein
MRRPKLETLAKSFDALLMEKRSLREKEHHLIGRLNKVLFQLGYRVEQASPARAGVSRKGRRRIDSRGRRVALKSADHSTPNHGAKRRGRPPLRKVA